MKDLTSRVSIMITWERSMLHYVVHIGQRWYWGRYLWSLVGCKQLNSGGVVNGSFFMMWVCIRHRKVPIQPIELARSWWHSNVTFRSLFFFIQYTKVSMFFRFVSYKRAKSKY